MNIEPNPKPVPPYIIIDAEIIRDRAEDIFDTKLSKEDIEYIIYESLYFPLEAAIQEAICNVIEYNKLVNQSSEVEKLPIHYKVLHKDYEDREWKEEKYSFESKSKAERYISLHPIWQFEEKWKVIQVGSSLNRGQ